MGAHIDDAEPAIDKPLISFSIGSTAIFLLGGKHRGILPTPIFLNSGDIIIQEGETRCCFHSVPRIIENSSPRDEFQIASKNIIDTYNSLIDNTNNIFGERIRKAISNKDININTVIRKPGILTSDTEETRSKFNEPKSWYILEDDIALLVEQISPYLSKYQLELPDVVHMQVYILDYIRINFNVRQVVNPDDIPPSQIRGIRSINHVRPQSIQSKLG